MKQSTFLTIIGALGLAVVVGAYFSCSGEETKIADDTVPPAPAPVPTMGGQSEQPKPLHQPTKPAPPPPADGPSERPVDKAVMKWVGKPLGNKKIKDAAKGQPFKINVYQDDGHDSPNRAKVDLDRDEKWDEKWTFKPNEISRKVSTNDDDNYDKEEVWKDGAWAAR